MSEGDAVVDERAVPAGVTPTEAAGQILEQVAENDDRIPRSPLQWLGMMSAAALVGALVGVVGVLFRLSLTEADHLRDGVAAFAHAHWPGWIGWFPTVCLCGAGAGLGCWLSDRLAPHTAGSGIPRIEAVLHNHLRPAAATILPVKFVGGILSIGSGLALGREGPTVQMGGTVGRLLDDLLARFTPEPWTMIAAGAGAGLAVAFNAPLAATVFVVEELIQRFSARVFAATLVACIAGTVVLRACLGNQTDFHVSVSAVGSARVLPEYLLLGAIAGVAGVGFNVGLLASLRAVHRLGGLPRGAKGAAVGAAAGLLVWVSPHLAGGGEALAQSAIISPEGWRLVLLMLSIRLPFTLASYGSGAPGGIFAPLLCLGSLLGSAFYAVSLLLHHAPTEPSAYAVVSMAACFTAVVRSPLTAVVLVLEMTGAWTLILPMMAASVFAYAVPELVGNLPIYESLRARDEQLERERGQVT